MKIPSSLIPKSSNILTSDFSAIVEKSIKLKNSTSRSHAAQVSKHSISPPDEQRKDRVLSIGRNRMLPGCISNRAEQLQVANSLSMIYEVIATFVAVVGVFVVHG
jgi:hypothetical protein